MSHVPYIGQAFYFTDENSVCIGYLTAEKTKLYRRYVEDLLAECKWLKPGGRMAKKINILGILRIFRQEVFGLFL